MPTNDPEYQKEYMRKYRALHNKKLPKKAKSGLEPLPKIVKKKTLQDITLFSDLYLFSYSEIQKLMELYVKISSKGLLKKAESEFLLQMILKMNNQKIK